MGCDIHIYLEQKDGDAWKNVPVQRAINLRAYDTDLPEGEHPIGFLRIASRDYNWFGALTNGAVRGHPHEMVHGLGYSLIPKGLPENMSSEMRWEADIDSADMHNSNWLPLKTFLEVRAAYTGELANIIAARMKGERYSGMSWEVYAEETFGLRYTFYDHPLEDFRVIFWFDN